MSNSSPPITKLDVHIHGVVLPVWFAACLLVIAIASAFILLSQLSQQRTVERELRVLQLHSADIENVLIRQEIGRREDFAEWMESNTTTQDKTKKQQRDKEKK